MNQFFDELGRRWVEAAQRRGITIDRPTLDSETAAELLELARVTAHTQERRFAPLSCYLAGVAVVRLGADDRVAAEFIREIRQELEREDQGVSER
jgi:hypothetical protein